MKTLTSDPSPVAPGALAAAASLEVVSQSLPTKRRALAGLLVRKECWQLSLKGRLSILLAVVVLVFAVQRSIYPFLTVTSREPAEYLVVEGWLPADSLREAFAEFSQGGYKKILTTGTVARSEWNPGVQSTYADWAASKFSKMGVPDDLVEAVPSWVERKDRTYYSALALKARFQEKKITVKYLNVVSKGPHARRTRLLFEKAFGNEVAIGIIALRDKDYDPAHWWRSSEGVRDVVGEGIAYLYARFLFSPD